MHTTLQLHRNAYIPYNAIAAQKIHTILQLHRNTDTLYNATAAQKYRLYTILSCTEIHTRLQLSENRGI